MPIFNTTEVVEIEDDDQEVKAGPSKFNKRNIKGAAMQGFHLTPAAARAEAIAGTQRVSSPAPNTPSAGLFTQPTPTAWPSESSRGLTSTATAVAVTPQQQPQQQQQPQSQPQPQPQQQDQHHPLPPYHARGATMTLTEARFFYGHVARQLERAEDEDDEGRRRLGLGIEAEDAVEIAFAVAQARMRQEFGVHGVRIATWDTGRVRAGRLRVGGDGGGGGGFGGGRAGGARVDGRPRAVGEDGW
ncbi:predicted protein [Chaetomium globosum CBS 148.51]|uniref:Uncharacterized protein n=1 Tax=Chaetomium globosum (strain ATCC 6205 / CBS 148.51 / DSM 1962 / NBRC 6347 / NRRL 1970) TaxID=306901 RepID=Q2H833_CHAGB|nr:uncharacterized protein CHGG_03621 [Chaetomium globosum CBS 148.51]EAQ91686.1 predicted protein [Chaetomium globosum CBS 148.51]